MRIYVAGPMTGHPQLNFPAFHAEAARLRALGYEVVNPAELNADLGADWLSCMRTDIKHLVDCDAIAMLEGWHHSRVARLEYTIALMLGHAVFRAVDIVEELAA
ncbi:DUF4406 domain-containing protein [Burkholderia cepacia]|uniref:DUF4406 domain-containing protein n=1 Tax=Burkholderia cepacia TaxID=292 RepID=UPI001CF19723|nr:DUF4406 domain-containing protein [Burkholderia cepacia]MCA8331868.1 DUF4406 domain-containing protein [Burkholderia cepacia]